MDAEKKKMSTAKLVALVISVGLHALLFFYLGRMALDYALPKGEVSSLEMNFDTSKGEQLNTTDVDVVETKPTPPPPKPKPEPKPEVAPTPAPPPPVAEKAPKAEPAKSLPKELPSKEVEEPVEDQQGTMPVATEIPEDTQKELMEDKPEATTAEQEAPKEHPPLENPPEIIPPQPTPEAPAALENPAPTQAQAPQAALAPQPTAAVTDQAYGTHVGGSAEPLIPFGTNRSHTYPYLARFRKYQGTAVVHYTVGTSGEVTDAKIVSSSGYSVLDDEAVDTIKKWKFKPIRSEVVYEKYVIFKLKGDAKEAPALLRRTKTKD